MGREPQFKDIQIEDSLADNEVLAYDSATARWMNQTASEAGLPTLNIKSAGQVINNDASPTIDADLQFTIGADEDWYIKATIFLSSSASADFQFGVSQPSGCSTSVSYWWPNASNTIDGGQAVNPTAEPIATGSTNIIALIIEIYVENSSNAGTWGITWAQNTSHGDSTSMHKGARLERWQIT